MRGTGRGRVVGCGLTAFLALAGVYAGPASEHVDGQKQTARWVETIPSSGTVRVRNPFGNVYARFGGYENQVELLATTQRLERELPELAVTVDTVEQGLEVAVRFGDGGDSSRATGDRVDLVLFVPRGATLDVETRDGSIEVKKLLGDVNATSVSGDLRLQSIGGRVQGKTARGKISATLETGATLEPQGLYTVTGEIEVWIGEDAELSVDLATSGEISTDFSIEIEHRRDEEPSKYAVATVGKGGPELRLRSKQGRVRLLRLQKKFTTDR